MAGDKPTDRGQLREALLVLRCQAGDEGAFSDLFDRFSHPTLRYLEGLLGVDAAADAQQEVWLAVYRGISRLTNPGAFRTWLYQITRHRAIDILRKEKRESELLAAVMNEEPVSPEEPANSLLESWDRRSLEAGLAQLSTPHREVLLLRFWEEMGYADIALISGCSVGTVRSRLHHAKRRLRDALERSRAEEDRGSAETMSEGGGE
ncbi:RNA polymerase sigma factor [Gemmatimonadota bacterium]